VPIVIRAIQQGPPPERRRTGPFISQQAPSYGRADAGGTGRHPTDAATPITRLGDRSPPVHPRKAVDPLVHRPDRAGFLH